MFTDKQGIGKNLIGKNPMVVYLFVCGLNGNVKCTSAKESSD